ncbi:MAG: ATP-binding protein [Thainema sp.]
MDKPSPFDRLQCYPRGNQASGLRDWLTQTASWQKILDFAPIGTAIVQRNGTFVYVNPAFCMTFEMSVQKAQWSSLVELIQAPDQPTYAALHHQLWTGKIEQIEMVYTYRPADGQTYPVLLKEALLPVDDSQIDPLSIVQILNVAESSSVLASVSASMEAADAIQSENNLRHLNQSLERQVKLRTVQLELANQFEATLKRITDKVRDSLNEQQILQTAVEELAIAVGVYGCNAALYDLDQNVSKVVYESTHSAGSRQGRVAQMEKFPELYNQLLQGTSFQFCSLLPHPERGRSALLAVPLIDQDQVIGDIWLINQSYYGFKAEDIRLVQQVANQCVIALRQAKLYQAAQAQVKELERLNQIKDDFLSTISHELRTPMASIKMATQMLSIMLAQLDPTLLNPVDSAQITTTIVPLHIKPRLQQYLDILQTECQREVDLINDLLDFSLDDSDLRQSVSDNTAISVLPIRWGEQLDLEELIQQLLSEYQDQLQQHARVLHVNLAADLNNLALNGQRIQRITRELLENAIKYTPAGETIQISARRLQDTVLIQVSNSGIHIPPQELNHIFDRFYRLPQSDRWQHRGTGLGLALVKRFVQSLNGTITATNRDRTLIITIQLPLAPSNQAQTAIVAN